MSLYKRKDSPYWWMRVPRPGLPPLRENTRVPIDAPTSLERRDQERLAQQLLNARLGDLARARFDLPTERPVIAFAAYAEWYAQHVTVQKRGQVRERSMLKALTRWFRRYQLHQIDRNAVLEWRTWRLKTPGRTQTERREQGLAAATVNRELDVLKHLLASAVPKYLDASPIAGMKRLRAIKRPIRILTEDEEARLFAAVSGEDRVLLLIARDTLMRLSDVKNLKWSHDHGTYFDVVDPKTEPYRVPISPRLRVALDALTKRSAFLFPRRRGRGASALSANTVHRLFAAACQAAAIPQGRSVGGVTFHSLRHTGTTRALERGANPTAVAAMGGWASIRQLDRYGHATPESVQKVAQIIGDLPRSQESVDTDTTQSRPAHKSRRVESA